MSLNTYQGNYNVKKQVMYSETTPMPCLEIQAIYWLNVSGLL